MKKLSDKRGFFPGTHQKIYLEEDVKQFIKDLKKEVLDKWYNSKQEDFINIVNKLAGDSLK